MTHSGGLDVSLETTCMCIVDASGRVVRELTVESGLEALATALIGTGLAFARIGEAGLLSQRLHAGLTRPGLPALLIETRRLRATTKRCRSRQNIAKIVRRVAGRLQSTAAKPSCRLRQNLAPTPISLIGHSSRALTGRSPASAKGFPRLLYHLVRN